MREILFRGKKDNGEWVYGAFYAYYDFKRTIVQILTDRTNGIPDAYEVIPETVGQFTGLTDENSKKIFEGDIVKAITCDVFGECFEAVVTADLDDFSLMLDIEYSNELEVVGNIHDNLELLKEGDDNG